MFETKTNLAKAGLCSQTLLVASKEQVYCELGEETAILGLKNSVYYGLDPVGARVWGLLQQPTTVGEIRDAIVSEYDVTAEDFERDLIGLLWQMLREGLVELSNETGARAGPE